MSVEGLLNVQGAESYQQACGIRARGNGCLIRRVFTCERGKLNLEDAESYQQACGIQGVP